MISDFFDHGSSGESRDQPRQCATGRRLDDPGDLVRLEIRTALARGVRVIPILVEGAQKVSLAILDNLNHPDATHIRAKLSQLGAGIETGTQTVG